MLIHKRGDCIGRPDVFTNTQVLIITPFEFPRGRPRRGFDKTAVGCQVRLSMHAAQDPTGENKKERERGMEDVYLRAMEMSAVATSGGREPQSSSEVTIACENTTEDCDLLREGVGMGRMRWGGASEEGSKGLRGLDAGCVMVSSGSIIVSVVEWSKGDDAGNTVASVTGVVGEAWLSCCADADMRAFLRRNVNGKAISCR